MAGRALAVNADQENAVVCEGYTFKALAGWNGQFDYAAFAKGEDEQARLVCSLATVALNGAKTYYEEKHDRSTFVKNIISDNILLGDIYVRAKELHFVSEVPRAVLLIRQVGTPGHFCHRRGAGPVPGQAGGFCHFGERERHCPGQAAA